MSRTAHGRTVGMRTAGTIAGLSAVALVAAGCANDTDDAAVSATTTAATSAATESSAAADSPTAAESSAATSGAAEESGDVVLTGERGVEVTLTGPIADKYRAASDAQRQELGQPLTGDHNAETRDSGVVFQQFQGGVIVAANNDSGTQAYIVSGPIRDAWNIERNAQGAPDSSGTNGSAGPLGYPTSDVTTKGNVQTATFQHGAITYNAATRMIEVTVNGHVNPAETVSR
ncbi:MAG: hypothetical protein WAW85_11570 [Gordonia sp. (in: high G+C Gram-positive bacteria)]|uniref:LGFP repeat-containing protein n=1 Tax=Gordonia sp. (in: high G+C Gram-positive bacteria) TaxID=84139 RepID=UPI003BB4C240